jgi:hypothetical protein
MEWIVHENNTKQLKHEYYKETDDTAAGDVPNGRHYCSGA